MWQFFILKVFLVILNVVPILAFATDFNMLVVYMLLKLLFLHNLPTFVKLLRFLEKILVFFLLVSVLFYQHLYHQHFLIAQQMLSAELLSDYHLINFV